MADLNDTIRLNNVTVDDISSVVSKTVHVLRLDKIHPVISGNKWFKLKFHLEQSMNDNHHTVLTFGGAYSNHIVATAFACRSIGMDSIGIIRGEEPVEWSDTLKDAKRYGMQLHFVSRDEYDRKEDTGFIDQLKKQFGKFYLIPEGAYGELGAKGSEEIVKLTDTSIYTHIICSVGTGTMMAGIVNATHPLQKVIGISSMKGNQSLEAEIRSLLKNDKREFSLLHDHHFGGYAKYDKALIDFMNELYAQTKIPTDFVYSGKSFFALFSLLKENYFSAADKVLAIHCGGLQGNRSLPAGILEF